MSSAKGQRENKAEDIAGAAARKEQMLADQMQTELQQRKQALGQWTQTGGFAPGEQEAFLRRASAGPAAIYARNQDQLNRQRSLQGGYMPGYTASAARLGRQGAQQTAEANLGANVGLAQQVRQGRQFGYQALSDVDINQLRNRLQAGQMSMEDARLLAQIASQDKDLFDKIKSVSGSIAGLAGAFYDPTGGTGRH